MKKETKICLYRINSLCDMAGECTDCPWYKYYLKTGEKL